MGRGFKSFCPCQRKRNGARSVSFLFLLLWADGLEGETVQSELPVDVRDRGRPSAQFARESSPSAPAKKSVHASVRIFYFFTIHSSLFTNSACTDFLEGNR